MTNYKLLLLSSLLAANVVQAEEPPPLPPNPFSNLPANNDNAFNSPFEDDFEDGEDAGEQAPQANGRRTPPGANRGGGHIGNVSGGGSNNSPGILPNQPALDAPNAKDIVDNFDYPDAEILDVAKAIAKLTRKNFIYNPQDIKGRISVVSQTPITVGDAWNAFLTALNMKGFALVPSGKYIRIERIANAKEKQIPIVSGKKASNTDEFITRVIPLRYIDAQEFDQAFRLWMPREARMQPYAQTNTIIITDTSVHINRMIELINLLDVAGYQESLVVIPVRNAPAKDLAKLIEQILNENASRGSGGGMRPGGNFQANRTATTRRGKSGGSTISKIIADDRTNALIVKANAAGLQEIRALVRRLDTKVAPSEGSGRLHVIPLQYADAEGMAKTLQAITGGGGSSRSGSNRGFPTFGEQQAAFAGEIKIAADKATQSIVVTASPQDFLTVKKVVEQLDLPRDQVFIEALLLEMRLDAKNGYGTSFVSAKNGVALPSQALQNVLTGSPLGLTGFALGFKKGGETPFTFNNPSTNTSSTINLNSLNGLLQLITTNSNSNVVATPQIIALDNEEATFEISEEIKLQSITTANNGLTQNSFTPEKAQTLLKVTPQINKASNFVKLNIDQRLENFDDTNVPSQLRGLTKGKNIRSTQTKVIVQNEDTVVISGLMRDSVTETENKVPILGDIPVLGWLFKNTTAEKTKSNLLVFITPRIIKQYDSIRKVLDRKLDEREEFIRENLGGRDPRAKQVAKIRQGLPDLTVIEPLPRKEVKESENRFSSPSSQDDRGGYVDDQYYDQDGFYYPPEGGAVPLPPMDNQAPMLDMPPGDAFPPAPVLPDQDQ